MAIPVDRSEARTVMFPIRLSAARRAELHRRAAEAGVSAQVYAEARIFDEEFRTLVTGITINKPGPKPKAKQSEELPMTG